MSLTLKLHAKKRDLRARITKLVSLALVALLFSGCAAITITDQGQPDHTYRPHYEESKHFFLWGLIGDHSVDVTKICRRTPVVQMQSKFRARDVAFAALTLGLYLPRTARVWCEIKTEAKK